MTRMSKRERILCAVRGGKPDALPYTFWTHLPGIDLDPDKLAEATHAFFREYDIDLVKTMNNGMYCVEDYGCEVDYAGITGGGAAVLARSPIQSASDWRKIEPRGIRAPALSRELRSLSLLIEKLKGEDVPVVFTVFSPLTIAAKLYRGRLQDIVPEGHAEAFESALEAIAQDTCALVAAALERGADGIYFATQMSDSHKATEAFYRVYGVPYDLRVLSASAGDFDIIHAHGDDILFDILKDYPADIFNWHAFESPPDLATASRETGRCIMAGLRREAVTSRDRAAVEENIRSCLDALHGRGHILSPGCVIRYPLDRDTLHFIREAKERIELDDMRCGESIQPPY